MQSLNAVIVETNWILDVALDRNTASVQIWRAAQLGEVRLHLPSICVTESVRSLDNMQGGWRGLGVRLAEAANDIGRSPPYASLAETLRRERQALNRHIDYVEAAFWQHLEALTHACTILEFRTDTVAATRQIREFLNLSRADAAVLATVIIASRQGICSTFLSRDSAFGEPGPAVYMAAEGIRFFGEPRSLLREFRIRRG